MLPTTSAAFAMENPICAGLLDFLERQVPSTYSTTHHYYYYSTTASTASTISSSRSSPDYVSAMPLNCTISDEEYAQKKFMERQVRMYKTKMCNQMVNGTCPIGDMCKYAHGMEELRVLVQPRNYKTTLCKNFSTTGSCRYGAKCQFIHY